MISWLFRIFRRALGLGYKLIATCLFMVYLLVARSFLYVLTLYVALYFLSGHGALRDFVQQAGS